MQKTGFFTKIIFCSISFKVSAWLFNHAVCKIGLNPSFSFFVVDHTASKKHFKTPYNNKAQADILRQKCVILFCWICF
jgi:uncharacterized ion transporter superfamily protein YfcC